jgi:16S rRNA G966 N2-methylase RsmD
VWYFYGRKKKIVASYPRPSHGIIIEPFAGSASYALHEDNWRHRVILVERDPRLAALWRWFIQEATEQDIARFPDPKLGEQTPHLLHILHSASKRWWQYNKYGVTPQLIAAWQASKPYMVASVHKVKHWEILEGDYTSAPDLDATWFIDPPYRGDAGTGYKFGSGQIDYRALGAWCVARRGQVMVCEAIGADWLPFRPHRTLLGAAGKTSGEALYTNTPDDEGNVLSLFGT